jgi:hypothetical protein
LSRTRPRARPLETPLNVRRKKRADGAAVSQVMPPPVQPDLFRFIDGAHEQPHLNREELDVREVDLDVASDDQPFVQNAVENLDQSVTARWSNEIRQAGTLRRRTAQPLLA